MSLNPKDMTEVDQEMIDGVWSDDPLEQFEYASKIRYALTHADDPPIDKIIESGVVPRFVEFLKKEDNIEIQYVAACVLRMISEGNTKVLIDHGVIQIFVRLLGRATNSVHLRFQAVWGLGNVASASVQSRDYVLRRGALGPLLAQLKDNTEIWMLTTAARTLLNLCAGQPRPPFHQMGPYILSALQRVLHKNDEFFLSNACWALYCLCDGSKQNIQTFINADIVPRLVQLLGHVSPSVIDPVVGIIMYLTKGVKQQTKVVMECGVLPLLANLLTQDYDTRWKNIKRDACWTISNITAGSEEQIQAVIDANLIPTLVNLAQNAELDIKKKAVCAISNASSSGSLDQIKYLVEQGCIKPLCDLLVCPDLRIISVCLNGLDRILMAGEVVKSTTSGDVNSYCQLIRDEEGLQTIDNLQHHDSKEIWEMALKIVTKYF